jgi:phage terminase small subunit
MRRATARYRAKSDDEDGEDSTEGQGKTSANPAMVCKAMQSKDLAHLQSTYGMRPNAFGKCVAKRARSKKS